MRHSLEALQQFRLVERTHRADVHGAPIALVDVEADHMGLRFVTQVDRSVRRQGNSMLEA